MGILTDNLTEEEKQELYDGVRKMVSHPGLEISLCGTGSLPVAFVWNEDVANFCVDDLVISMPDNQKGQHHLELDESTLESAGKSVSVDEVIAKIDELTDN